MLNQKEINLINSLNKTNLHIHLDGSIRAETMLDISKKEGFEFRLKLSEKNIKKINDCCAEELKSFMSVKECNIDLGEYLKKFGLSLKFLQKKEYIERITFELLEDMKKQDNIVYSEIRYSPYLFQEEGLSLSEIVESVSNGIKKAEKELGVLSNQILCIVRGNKEEMEWLPLVELSKKYNCGIDVAGDEAKYSINKYKNFLKEVKKENIPLTIHAGEARDYTSVIDSINAGATRIGHGINAIYDNKTIELIKEKNICLEVCPISNHQTKAVKNFEDNPIFNFQRQGVKVCLNTDNNLISNTTLKKEMKYLNKHIGFKMSEMVEILNNGFEFAFPLNHKKEDILKFKEENEEKVKLFLEDNKNKKKITNERR